MGQFVWIHKKREFTQIHALVHITVVESQFSVQYVFSKAGGETMAKTITYNIYFIGFSTNNAILALRHRVPFQNGLTDI